jgi:hypothetical protein
MIERLQWLFRIGLALWYSVVVFLSTKSDILYLGIDTLDNEARIFCIFFFLSHAKLEGHG